MNAELITIGDEILIGQIVDTNSAWMATELNAIGFSIEQITSISDQPEAIAGALDQALQRATVVLVTGGLGPTKDDRTKKVLASYFGSPLVMHQPTLDHVTEFFRKRGMGLTKLNEEQALVPACCEVLPNENGTAPGMWFEKEGKVVVSMPGVPFEMMAIMQQSVLPRLAAMNGGDIIVHKTVLTTGIPESILAEKIEAWEDALPGFIKLAYLPSPEQIRLRFTATGYNKKQLEDEIDQQINKLKELIPEAVFGYGTDSLAAVVGKILACHEKTLGTAESCTGGNIAHQITLVPGSSKWYKGSVVAYSNDLKEDILGVSPGLLATYGAVSEPVVRQMAEGARKLLNTEYAIATSGIAGPDGGSEEKPVGLVWIAVSGPNGTQTTQYRFTNNRERNIVRATQSALNFLRLRLLSDFGLYEKESIEKTK
jgi:nicotinamide-nucleotide amidase